MKLDIHFITIEEGSGVGTRYRNQGVPLTLMNVQRWYADAIRCASRSSYNLTLTIF